MAVTEAKLNETYTMSSFPPRRILSPLAFVPEFGSGHEPLSAVQELIDLSPSGPATRANPLVNYDYSSASVFDFDDSGDLGSLPSPFDHQ